MLILKKHNNLKHDLFIEKPKIVQVRRFNEESLETFSKDFALAESSGQEIIPIHIDSYGGSVYSLLGMLDVISNSSKKICTFTNTKAMSCGAVLLASGTEGFRFASKTSTILVHEISSGSFGRTTDMENEMEYLTQLNETLLSILDTSCKQDKGYFKNLLFENCNADLYFSPQIAKSHRLIDKVKSPVFGIEVQQKVTVK